MSLGIFQVLVSLLVDALVPIMWDKMTQLSVVWQSVCLDLKWNETLWNVSMLTLVMPCICACVLVLDNFKRCTHLSVMKCECEEISNYYLHGIFSPDFFWTSTMTLASRILSPGLPLNEEYVLSSTVKLPLPVAGPFISDYLTTIDWICLSMSLETLTGHLSVKMSDF